jgi:hypothetical protein
MMQKDNGAYRYDLQAERLDRYKRYLEPDHAAMKAPAGMSTLPGQAHPILVFLLLLPQLALRACSPAPLQSPTHP